MIYQTTLILEKGSSRGEKEPIDEIEKYVQEKKGKMINSKLLGERQITLNKKRSALALTYRLNLELAPKEVDKIKKRIKQEKSIISFILEKKQKIKEIKKDKRKMPQKETKKPLKKESQTTKVLDSIQEEEKKIKDLDSTLDELLNE